MIKQNRNALRLLQYLDFSRSRSYTQFLSNDQLKRKKLNNHLYEMSIKIPQTTLVVIWLKNISAVFVKPMYWMLIYWYNYRHHNLIMFAKCFLRLQLKSIKWFKTMQFSNIFFSFYGAFCNRSIELLSHSNQIRMNQFRFAILNTDENAFHQKITKLINWDWDLKIRRTKLMIRKSTNSVRCHHF